MKLYNASLLIILAALPLFSQSSSAPPQFCTAPELKQFNFWIGDWNLTWPGKKPDDVGRGTNRITRILGDCVIQENFSGGDSHLRGTSLSTFDASGKWKQTWVDNEGAYLDFTGEFKEGQMILQREALGPNGAKSRQRMVWKNITPNEFDWSWEASTDNGKTWQVQWPIHYKRKI